MKSGQILYFCIVISRPKFRQTATLPIQIAYKFPVCIISFGPEVIEDQSSNIFVARIIHSETQENIWQIGLSEALI